MTLNKFGTRIAQGAQGSHQLVANPSCKAASPPIAPDLHCRNGKKPSATLLNALNEAANQSVLYRSRQIFCAYGRLFDSALPSSLDEIRWRFAFRTSSWTHALHVQIAMLPDGVSPVLTVSSSARLDIYSDATESTLVKSVEFVYGSSPTHFTSDQGYAHIKVLAQYVDGLDPDTDYYARLSSVNIARIVSATILDMQSLTQHASGYMPQNLTTHSAVLDVYRENLADVSYNLWRRQGGHVLNWTVDEQGTPLTRTSSTAVNIIDGASTTNTAATPGYRLDMRGKARVSQTTGVPVVMKVYADQSAPGPGTVKLVNSSGVAVLTASITTSASWVTATGVLPATQEKYDLQYSSAGGTLTLYAVSIWEQD